MRMHTCIFYTTSILTSNVLPHLITNPISHNSIDQYQKNHLINRSIYTFYMHTYNIGIKKHPNEQNETKHKTSHHTDLFPDLPI